MQETTGDIFDYLKHKTDALCIFTNGIVNKQGLAIAGAGQAGHAANKWFNFRQLLGSHIQTNGNVAGIVGIIHDYKLFPNNGMELGIKLISFPTKEHFNNPSIPKLIQQSAQQLVKIVDELKLETVVLGKPGCGKFTGKLDWDKDVKSLISPILDNRFIIVSKE